MKPSGNGQLFQVEVSQQTLEVLKQIQVEEIDAGRGAAFLDALRALYDRLRTDPEGFGVRLYRLPVLRLTVYTAGVAPLELQYAVHEEKPLVFIRWIGRKE